MNFTWNTFKNISLGELLPLVEPSSNEMGVEEEEEDPVVKKEEPADTRVNDSAILHEIETGALKIRDLEKRFNPAYYPYRAVGLRRRYIEKKHSLCPTIMQSLPYKSYKYEEVG